MKKIILLTLAGAFAGFSFAEKDENAETYKLSKEASKVEWTGKKVTGQHSGNISIEESELFVKNDIIEGGTIIFDMTSITCNDMQGEMSDKLVSHLKSNDFFSVEKFKTATFKIKSVKLLNAAEEGKANQTITGDLTIKGITHEISFPAMVSFKNGKMVAIGEATVDRSKFDVRFGSPSFFENIGEKAIYDDFTLNFKLAAKK